MTMNSVTQKRPGIFPAFSAFSVMLTKNQAGFLLSSGLAVASCCWVSEAASAFFFGFLYLYLAGLFLYVPLEVF
jgi:hypothetical protein